jgi:hypothetical protein
MAHGLRLTRVLRDLRIASGSEDVLATTVLESCAVVINVYVTYYDYLSEQGDATLEQYVEFGSRSGDTRTCHVLKSGSYVSSDSSCHTRG